MRKFGRLLSSMLGARTACASLVLLCIVGWMFSPCVPANAQTFSTPTRVSPFGIAWENPQLAVDPAGVNFLWKGSDLNRGVWFRRSIDDGATFTGDPVLVLPQEGTPILKLLCIVTNDNTYQCPRQEHFTVDGEGNVYVVANWAVNYTLWGLLFTRSTDHGTNFSAPLVISGDDGFDPQIAVDGAGKINVVWSGSSSSGNDQVFFSRSTDGGLSFSQPINLSESSAYAYEPRMALDAAGNINLVWTEDPFPGIPGGDQRQIFFRRLEVVSDAVVPLPAVALSSPGQESYLPQIAVNQAGNIYVVWGATNSADYGGDVMIRSSVDAGASFSVPKRVGGSISIGPPGIAVDDLGGVNLVWEAHSPGDSAIIFRHSSDGGSSFDEAVLLMLSGPGPWVGYPQITLDQARNIDVVWGAINSSIPQLELFFQRSTDGGATFCLPQSLGPTGKEYLGRAMVTDGRGNVNVTWIQPWTEEGASSSAVVFARMSLGSTPTGEDITVQPVDPVTGTSPVTITFGDVTQPGETTVATASQGPPLPQSFKLGNPPTYYEISTTATVTPPITVCFNYSGVSYKKEENLKLGHWTGTGWEELTPTSLDTVNHILCAQVSSFSIFALLEPGYNFLGFLPPVRSDGSAVFKSGRTIPLKFQLTDVDGSSVTDAKVALAVFKVTNDVLGTVEVEVESSGSSNAENSFRFDPTTNQYVYNLSTSGYMGTYLLRVTLDDGSTHEVYVSVR